MIANDDFVTLKEEYDDDFEQEKGVASFPKYNRPFLRYTKDMYEDDVRETTHNRNEYLKTQSQIMAYIGKTEENNESDEQNTNPNPDKNPGTKRHKKYNKKNSEAELKEIEKSVVKGIRFTESPSYIKDIAEDQAPSSPPRSDSLQFLFTF